MEKLKKEEEKVEVSKGLIKRISPFSAVRSYIIFLWMAVLQSFTIYDKEHSHDNLHTLSLPPWKVLYGVRTRIDCEYWASYLIYNLMPPVQESRGICSVGLHVVSDVTFKVVLIMVYNDPSFVKARISVCCFKCAVWSYNNHLKVKTKLWERNCLLKLLIYCSRVPQIEN